MPKKFFIEVHKIGLEIKCLLIINHKEIYFKTANLSKFSHIQLHDHRGVCNQLLKKLGLLAQHRFYCSKICSSPDVLLSLALGHMLNSELFYLFVHSPYICSHLTYVLRTDGRSAERPSQACSSFNASTHIRSPSSSLPKQLRLPRVTSIETIFCLFCGGTSEDQQV